MSDVFTIKEVEDNEEKLRKGELVVTLLDDMPHEVIGKIIHKKLSRSNGAPITVKMVEGDPTQK